MRNFSCINLLLFVPYFVCFVCFVWSRPRRRHGNAQRRRPASDRRRILIHICLGLCLCLCLHLCLSLSFSPLPMVAKKHTSKRVTLRQRYKVVKRVAEHKRKLKKLAKKHPHLVKKRKDPGIPNSWPFKQEEMENVEKARESAEAHRQQVKALKKQAKASEERKGAPVDEQPVSVSGRARERMDYRAIDDAITNSSLVIEVLDARDPLGSRWQSKEVALTQQGDKQLIFVLNKCELIPPEHVRLWLAYLNMEAPTFAFFSPALLNSEAMAGHQLKQADNCPAAEALTQLMQNFKPVARTGRGAPGDDGVNVCVIGYGNVGKSAVVNALVRSPVAAVGPNPGFTKQTHRYRIKKGLFIYDTPSVPTSDREPGPHINLPLDNSQHVFQLLVQELDSQQVMKALKVPHYDSPAELLDILARQHGKLMKGGRANTLLAARTFLKSWNASAIPYTTKPPVEATKVANKKATVSAGGLDKLVSDANRVTCEAADRIRTTKNEQFIHVQESLIKRNNQQEEEDDDEEDDEEEDDEDGEESADADDSAALSDSSDSAPQLVKPRNRKQ